jgi:hypothetical protein
MVASQRGAEESALAGEYRIVKRFQGDVTESDIRDADVWLINISRPFSAPTVKSWSSGFHMTS